MTQMETKRATMAPIINQRMRIQVRMTYSRIMINCSRMQQEKRRRQKMIKSYLTMRWTPGRHLKQMYLCAMVRESRATSASRPT